MMTDYTAVYWGILVAIVTLILQGVTAAASKGAQEGAVPGKIDESLSHSSFVFRSHRTFMNSLENIPAFLGAAILAVFVGADTFWTALYVWLFAGARIVHMVLYYLIATEKNPSPRSYFYLLGLLANIALLSLCGASLL